MMLLRQVIGRVLRRLRQDQGRTLHDVARTAGLSTAYLSEVERGRKEASSEMLASICRALGVALEELLQQAMQELTRHRPMASRGYRQPGVSARRGSARPGPGRGGPRGDRPIGRPTGRAADRVVAGPSPHRSSTGRPPRPGQEQATPLTVISSGAGLAPPSVTALKPNIAFAPGPIRRL
ncbi:helix-turn-helix transcriptional regulator [Solwaraspora sp. WMMD406]|uniref:helix-turn-helix domain-containing protein n=1 Tax=Solwaraspora sp. WMMD406 TaxID=3016095 RepID=UPI002415D0E6|nr:helix-turn-helix transcriptional regulator [Solwaraspora sp. WMMD406]MDG4766626.1 helix-turn-helix transcriptional regulator [Solwaraspora sp. WMMD406]